MARVEDLEKASMLGLADEQETKTAIRDLGVNYQIVNDETAMVVMRDESFKANGIERRNQARTATEHAAQAQRAAVPVQNYRIDNQQPMFPGAAHSLGNGGGALDVSSLLVMLLLGIGALLRRRNAA